MPTSNPAINWEDELAQINTPKLISFVYSREQAYLLVIVDGYIKIFRSSDGQYLTQIYAGFPSESINDLRWAQQGNVMVFVHPYIRPRRLVRDSGNDFNWTLEDLDIVQYAVSNTWYRSGTFELKIIDLGVIDDQGDPVRYNVGDYWEWEFNGDGTLGVGPNFYDFTGTLITDGAALPGTIVVTLANDRSFSWLNGNGRWRATCILSEEGRSEWTLSKPSFGSVDQYPHGWGILPSGEGWPQSVTFYQQRLWFGGAGDEPQTLWGSKVGDYTNFSIGPDDDDSVEFQIASSDYDEIIHLQGASNQLLIFTYSSEFILGASGAIAPSNVQINVQTHHGCSNTKPLQIGADTLFVQRDGRKLRSIYFDINQSQNMAEDLTLFAEHITEGGIRSIAYQQDPDQTIWAVREDGVMLTCAYQRDQSVAAWSSHETWGRFVDVAVVPDNAEDKVYVCVQRLDGDAEGPAFFIEVFDKDVMVDCARYYIDGYGAPLDEWDIDWQYTGQYVRVVADGFDQGEFFMGEEVDLGYCNSSGAEEIARFDFGSGDNRGITFNSDGTIAYVSKTLTSRVIAYDLATPYDIETMTPRILTLPNNTTISDEIDISAYDDRPGQIAWSPDGTKFFVPGGQNWELHEYHTMVPWQLADSSHVRTEPVNDQSGGLLEFTACVQFSNDGQKLFISGNRHICEFELIEPYTLVGDGNHTFTRSYDVGSRLGYFNPYFAWSETGNRLYVGATNGEVRHLQVNTPFTLQTYLYWDGNSMCPAQDCSNGAVQGVQVIEGCRIVSTDGDNLYMSQGSSVLIQGTSTLTLPYPQGDNGLWVGYTYDTEVKLLHPEPELNETSQGRELSIDKITFRFQDTRGTTIARENETIEVLPFAEFDDSVFDELSDLYTGDKVINLVGWSGKNEIQIKQDLAYPWTLLALIMRITVNDM